eukprot:gene18225-37050_t
MTPTLVPTLGLPFGLSLYSESRNQKVAMSFTAKLPTRTNYVDEVYKVLLDAISDGSLAPGTRITQEEVAEQLDVSRSPVIQALRQLKTDGLVNGQWVAGGSRFDVLDPATGHKLADVANLGPKDAEAAIAAANAAWPAWKAKTAKERSTILRKWFDLLMANQEDLGRILTAEQGKPFTEAKGEIAYGASFVEWFAEEAKRVN